MRIVPVDRAWRAVLAAAANAKRDPCGKEAGGKQGAGDTEPCVDVNLAARILDELRVRCGERELE